MEFELRILQKYHNGLYIFILNLFNLIQVRWFTDNSDWFVYLYLCNWYVRFSSAGFIKGKLNAKPKQKGKIDMKDLLPEDYGTKEYYRNR